MILPYNEKFCYYKNLDLHQVQGWQRNEHGQRMLCHPHLRIYLHLNRGRNGSGNLRWGCLFHTRPNPRLSIPNQYKFYRLETKKTKTKKLNFIIVQFKFNDLRKEIKFQQNIQRTISRMGINISLSLSSQRLTHKKKCHP